MEEGEKGGQEKGESDRKIADVGMKGIRNGEWKRLLVNRKIGVVRVNVESTKEKRCRLEIRGLKTGKRSVAAHVELTKKEEHDVEIRV